MRAMFKALGGILILVLSCPAATAAAVSCSDEVAQGGVILCRGAIRFEIWRAGVAVAVSAPELATDGKTLRELAVVGVRRDAASPVALRSIAVSGARRDHLVRIIARNDEERLIEGMDCDQLDARTDDQKDHASRSWRKKRLAFADFHPPGEDRLDFVLPATGVVSSPFGPVRRYVGTSRQTGRRCEKIRVHRGMDLATPTGSDLLAPLAGTVILADPDLYYEGGAVFLDHGRGLVSVFMHLSEVAVRRGRRVVAGERLGATGNTGRTSGPHLHWGVKWRNVFDSDRSGDFYIDPALLPGLAVDPQR